MYRYFNPNPKNRFANDCVVRAICKLFSFSWHEAYIKLVVEGYYECEIPTTNYVWERYLQKNGYIKELLPNCPDCITVREFSKVNRHGKFLLCMGDHVVPVIDGDYYDASDSGSEVVSYFFYQRKE